MKVIFHNKCSLFWQIPERHFFLLLEKNCRLREPYLSLWLWSKNVSNHNLLNGPPFRSFFNFWQAFFSLALLLGHPVLLHVATGAPQLLTYSCKHFLWLLEFVFFFFFFGQSTLWSQYLHTWNEERVSLPQNFPEKTAIEEKNEIKEFLEFYSPTLAHWRCLLWQYTMKLGNKPTTKYVTLSSLKLSQNFKIGPRPNATKHFQ